jgi:hypothetical protein
MARTRLALYNFQGSPTISLTNCPVLNDIPLSLTYQISDVRTPEKRSGSKSRSFRIPATQEVNQFFENIFEVNVSLSKFNPTKKVTAIYYVDERVNMDGYLRMVEIVKKDTNEVYYECILIGETAGFFNVIAGKYLTDLDFSEINHILSYSAISGSWANTSGATWTSTNASRAYPLIDWGDNKSNLTSLSPKNFRLCLFARDILLKMFIAAGYTWESTFLDSDLFKRLVVTPTKGIALDSTTIANNKFLAVANGSEKVYNGVSLTYNTGLLTYTNLSFTNINFQTETYDTGGIFATPTLTPATTNQYNTVTNIGIKVVVYRDTGAGAVDQSGTIAGLSGSFGISILKGSSVIAGGSINVANITFGSSGTNYVSVNLPNTVLASGQNYVVKIQAYNIQMLTSSGSATWTMDVTILNGSNYSTEFTSNQAYDGITVNANNAIPENIKQTDFFSSLIRLFNLYVQVDKNDSKKLIVEPREDFYLTTPKNWRYKFDPSIEEVSIPLGEFDTTKYIYTYKQDQDFYNKWHLETFKEVYGQHEEIVTNDFIYKENKTELIFSPTPYAKSPYSNIITGTIVQKNNGVTTEINPNIRLLYYKQQTLVNAQIAFTYAYPSAGAATITSIPLGGHTDNPYNPTLDLNFGLPNLPYVYPNQYWTTNNAYNKYYSRYINQITDKNSKIVIAYFNLTPQDIATFDFRYPIFYINNKNEQAYYLVNKIVDYNPLSNQSTKVELLKLTNYDAFTPTDIDMSGGVGGGNNSAEKVYLDNIIKGDNNNNYGENCMIVGGSGNYIANG